MNKTDDTISDEELRGLLGISKDETDTYHKGNGYAGTTSNNALDAYAEGRMPMSKWTKKDFIEHIDANREIINCDYELLINQPVDVLKSLLLFSGGEYHHTSFRFNVTMFYHFSNESLSSLTDKIIKQTAANIKAQKQKEHDEKLQKAADDKQYDGRWEAIYTKRSVNGRFKRDIVMRGEVRNSWFYPDQGSEFENKRNIHSKCFRLVNRL